MLKKILLSLSLVLGSQIYAETLKIGMEGAFPPFSFMKEDGSIDGFDVEITRALCADMKVECELKPMDWDGLIPALQAKKIDAIIASMSITDERRQVVDFTNKYYTNKFQFVGPKGVEVKLDKASMKGKKIGVQRATISSNYIEDTYGDTVTISAYDTQENAYLDLLAGRIDLVLGDLFVQDTWLKTDLGKSFEFKGEPVINTDLVGIAIRKNSNDLKVKFNQAIDNIRANGIYKQINDKYFATDIY